MEFHVEVETASFIYVNFISARSLSFCRLLVKSLVFHGVRFFPLFGEM